MANMKTNEAGQVSAQPGASPSCALGGGSDAATPAAEPTEEQIYLEQLQAEERENWVQVTREMARDAGDPSYEGAWIKW